MRPAAVCNHQGPRRAAREVAREPARGGVEGGGDREVCAGGGRGCAPRERQAGGAGCSAVVTPILSQPCHRAVILPISQVSTGD